MESDQIKNLRSQVVGHPLFQILLKVSYEEGVELYLVGGLVRDRLLGRETLDVDLTLNRGALRTARRFAEQTGGTFVLLREEGEAARIVIQGRTFDFCNFRGPDLVADLRGRDFTVNAIALSLSRAFAAGEWIPYDPLGGIKDLQNRVLRGTGPKAFEMDPLRMLRAFRFSSQLDLTIEDEVHEGVKKWAWAITRCAPERIHYEWELLLAQPNSIISIRLMDRDGLLAILFPALECLKGIEQNRYHHLDVFQHSLSTLQYLEELIQRIKNAPSSLEQEIMAYLGRNRNQTYLKWAALFHDLGKAVTCGEKEGRKTFYGHPEESRKQFELIAEKYRLGNQERGFIGRMISRHMGPLFLVEEDRRGRLTRRAMIRFVREMGGDLSGLFLLALADSLAAQGSEKPEKFEDRLKDLWQRALILRNEWIHPLGETPPLINGKDLIELGLTPGPIYSTILTLIREARLEGEISTRDEAFEWIKKRTGMP